MKPFSAQRVVAVGLSLALCGGRLATPTAAPANVLPAPQALAPSPLFFHVVRPISARSALLLARRRFVKSLDRKLWRMRHAKAKTWFKSSMMRGGWIDRLARMTLRLEADLARVSAWTDDERAFAGRLALQLRQTVLHLEAKLRTIDRKGWRERITLLNDHLDRIDLALLVAAGRRPAPPAMPVNYQERWKDDFRLAGVPADRIGLLTVGNTSPYHGPRWGAVAMNAWDLLALVGGWKPEWRLVVYQNDRHHAELIVAAKPGGENKFIPMLVLNLFRREPLTILVGDGLWFSKLVRHELGGALIRAREWMPAVFMPWLLRRGFARLRMAHAGKDALQILEFETNLVVIREHLAKRRAKRLRERA